MMRLDELFEGVQLDFGSCGQRRFFTPDGGPICPIAHAAVAKGFKLPSESCHRRTDPDFGQDLIVAHFDLKNTEVNRFTREWDGDSETPPTIRFERALKAAPSGL